MYGRTELPSALAITAVCINADALLKLCLHFIFYQKVSQTYIWPE